MVRNTGVIIDKAALRHNLSEVSRRAPQKKIIAMVKGNAYGCGLESIVPTLSTTVDALGVSCMSEAVAIRKLGVEQTCVLFAGIFARDELEYASTHNIQVVVHAAWQLEIILNTRLAVPLQVWIKLDSGLHRLGFSPGDIIGVYQQLIDCRWVDVQMGLMSHFACADNPEHPLNQQQLECFMAVQHSLPKGGGLCLTMANSAAIIANPAAHFDCVRPGIMLYGVSPFANTTAQALNLQPVMHFHANIIAIHDYPAGESIGYGATWKTSRPSRIAVVAAGYGDGYPRRIQPNTLVAVQGVHVPIVGRVSMDYLTIDISSSPQISVGDSVELWGNHIPIETVASSADTIAYELLNQFRSRR